MQNFCNLPWMFFNSLTRLQEKSSEKTWRMFKAGAEQMKAYQTYLNGITNYTTDFTIPYWIALNSFLTTEWDKLGHPPSETIREYLELAQLNLQVARKGLNGSLKTMNAYHVQEASKAFSAWLNTIFDREGDDILDFSTKLSKLMEITVHAYPKAIRNIEPEFGFHFEDGGYIKIAETDRFILYQVLPIEKEIEVREQGKPTLIIPPYVLGANILAFLPGEQKSYVHAFANQGIPTYIRVLKDIKITPAVQSMRGEDDARDTRVFCEKIFAKHGKPVTLNGYCQGGFISMLNLLSGELDDLVDALISCVAPIDGTRSKSLSEYLTHIPMRFRDLEYAVKTLPNGNRVVDGRIISLVFKLRCIEKELPLITFYRNLMTFDKQVGKEVKMSKTAMALNYWLLHDQTDLPVVITQMSFDSYTIPVTADGTLPVKLFGRTLNLRRLQERGIKWLICYAKNDDLVDKEAALAPLEYIDAEVTMFPKGHAAIATSWSHPASECALHTRFGENYRGPVRYHLDLEEMEETP